VHNQGPVELLPNHPSLRYSQYRMPKRFIDAGFSVPTSWKRPTSWTLPTHRIDPWNPLRHGSGIPWAEWKAATLNRLFQEQGITGQPGRITAATVRNGERKTRGKESLRQGPQLLAVRAIVSETRNVSASCEVCGRAQKWCIYRCTAGASDVPNIARIAGRQATGKVCGNNNNPHRGGFLRSTRARHGLFPHGLNS
jgi:hypothetical protein